jgi:ribose transport system permease protein
VTATQTPKRTGSGSTVHAVTEYLRQGRLPTATAFALLLIAIALNAYMQPNFFGSYSIRSNFSSFTPLVATAIGQTIIVLGGGIDLSIGAIVTLVSVVTVVLMDGATPLPLALLAGLGVGAGCGLVNGFIVSVIRLQPIVATFATSFIWGGLALRVLPRPGGQVPAGFYQGYRETVLGVPVAAIAIAVLAVLWVALKRQRLGRHIYAMGGDEQAAFASGVNVTRVKIASYVLGGVFAALGGFAILANTGSGDPFVGGGLTLTSIAALVIGGTRLSGGAGGAGGSIAGAMVLGLVSNIVFFAQVPTAYRELINGVIVIAALALAGVWARRRA